jgi:hypothetical protein
MPSAVLEAFSDLGAIVAGGERQLVPGGDQVPLREASRPQGVMSLQQEAVVVGTLGQHQEPLAQVHGYIDLAAAPPEQEQTPKRREELRSIIQRGRSLTACERATSTESCRRDSCR